MMHIINKSNENWYDAEKERAQFSYFNKFKQKTV